MVFNSAIFLFAFLPFLFVLYRLVPGIKAKNAVLCVFSLVFYAFGSVWHVLLLLASVFINWLAGRLLGGQKKRKVILTATLVLNLGVLVAFKYLDFFIENINALLGTGLPLVGLALPIGISFYTFAGLSYVLDTYYEPSQSSRSFGRVLLFMSMFPTVTSGPILNYKSFSPQLDERTCTPEKTAKGLRRFIVGLAKKVLIADIVGGVVNAIYASSALDARLVWLGALAYSIQIYYDFSGCSDMAIGLGGMFGFTIPENFRLPYLAAGVTDFWSRWHISLTTWFRTYLYYPLTMSKGLKGLYKKFSAKGKRKLGSALSSVIALAIVWLLTGLWHGPNWCFVLWGLWHGLMNILEGVNIIPVKKLRKNWGGRLFLHVYTLLVMLLGTVLFRCSDLAQAGQMFTAMFTGFAALPEATLLLQKSLTGIRILALIAGVIGCAGFLPWLEKRCGKWGEALSYVLCLGLAVLCVMSMAGSGFQPFIYAQF